MLGVFIISPKFRLKAPSGLGDPSIERLEWSRGRFFLSCQGSSDPEAVCSGRGLKVPTISSVESRAWSGSSDLLVICSSRLLFCRKFRQYLLVGLGLGPEVPTSWSYIPVGCCSARFCSALSVVVSISLPLCFLAFQALSIRSR
jgi:hypothetical protein